MNAIAAPFVLPFHLIARYPWPSIIASTVVAIACYFMDYGSGLAFFVCLSCGIFIWHYESSQPGTVASPETT
ncbi:hypothetical protein EBE87_01715 [Pseudoroseomonas wenyumeiae]|uniref:Uncharacterized protein n=1 Tax=Teichococcus wenyumeiae TaxID=2478470 RepID=A0A3A9JIR4_9PROT|nr:hypothetical protein [Pseudoroseomonas wenyumeiae]RKK03584.1 hypothetical protein D6Z83_13825 [Pseudoroseomonas wenyumeiae]RMI27117.1 hypothetical protein EBE87_01715 [Pseudoroseomonas wenyumeiae]